MRLLLVDYCTKQILTCTLQATARTTHNCLIVRGNPDACSLTEAARVKHKSIFTLINIKRGDSRMKNFKSDVAIISHENLDKYKKKDDDDDDEDED
ncbi:CLUMA_CG019299, isoform A [Clunio marinus]|uniref:CLUMA_CG019299, isoform A n=1 Tax=Clunio marinus TaxID=568069 RepID=A0A1J1J3A2_9DIPT|nr:CLUMA_CG019299, isoform A [Clunio marinus]